MFFVNEACFLVVLKIGHFWGGRQNTPKTSILGHFRGLHQKYSPRAVPPPKTLFLAILCPYDTDHNFRGVPKNALFWPFFGPLFDPFLDPQKWPFFGRHFMTLLHQRVVLSTSLITFIRSSNSSLWQALLKTASLFLVLFVASPIAPHQPEL